MKYVDWVQAVASAFIVRWKASAPSTRGVRISQILEELNLPAEDDASEAVRAAMGDLMALGLMADAGTTIGPDGAIWKPTQEGRKLATQPLRSSWPAIFEIHLDEDQLEFLTAVSRLGVRSETQWVRRTDVSAQAICEALGKSWDDPEIMTWGYQTFEDLKTLGLVYGSAFGGGYVRVDPAYLGIVRSTEVEATEGRALLVELVKAGETTNVDFKRELNLERERGKSEFVRDVLGLANSQLSGDRFLLVGIDDDGDEFPANSPLDVERLEQILQGWASSVPPLSLQLVRWNLCDISLLRVGRDPHHLPYVPTKSSGKLKIGVVYVRHGRHTQPADPDEEADIRTEGERARSSPT